MSVKAMWQIKNSENSSVKCELCPHNCTLSVGQVGVCKVRENRDGELISTVFGRPVALHLDPIEKKPLSRFNRGSKVLSLGTVGCNLSCQFCQNWEISQSSPRGIRPQFHSPESVIKEAKRVHADGIAFTYTEPTIFYEYTLAIAELAQKEGLTTVLVSNGYVNEKPLRHLARFIDAANIDLKSISDSFYKKYCGGSVAPVLQSMAILKEMEVHLEVSNLIIPQLNDSPEELQQLAEWVVKNCGEDTPIHFSRFFPRFQLLDAAVTPMETLEMAKEIAEKSGLKYIYLGNV